jgi:hypothetical protein
MYGRTVMPRQIITTANAPEFAAVQPGVKNGPLVLVSGIIGIDPGTGSLLEAHPAATKDEPSSPELQQAKREGRASSEGGQRG